MKYLTYNEKGDADPDGETWAERDCRKSPSWAEWYAKEDKTVKQAMLPGFERCRACLGTGHTPAGFAAPLTGFPCSTCKGRGVVLAE